MSSSGRSGPSTARPRKESLQRPDAEVLVVGGGPAGAAVSAFLARAGVDCLVLERQRFPRPHVGESLVPAANLVLDDLGLLGRMDERYERKTGAAWTVPGRARVLAHDLSGLGTKSPGVLFGERPHESPVPHTWHVDRATFDEMLLSRAVELGARVRFGAQVLAFGTDARSRMAEVRVREGGRERDYRARLVIDASGRDTLIGKQLRLRRHDPGLDQFAAHTWFEGFDRGTSRADHIWIHFLESPRSWVWQIPISADTTSIGVVAPRAVLRAAGRAGANPMLELARQSPELHHKLRRSRASRPVRVEGDYSYSMERCCGERFVLLGDAARFVDPIFSSGVSIALRGAQALHRVALEALEQDALGPEGLRPYVEWMARATDVWSRFIHLYYRLEVAFLVLLEDERTRLELLRLIQGEVYDQEAQRVIARMQGLVEAVERDPQHLWRGYLDRSASRAEVTP